MTAPSVMCKEVRDFRSVVKGVVGSLVPRRCSPSDASTARRSARSSRCGLTEAERAASRRDSAIRSWAWAFAPSPHSALATILLFRLLGLRLLRRLGLSLPQFGLARLAQSHRTMATPPPDRETAAAIRTEATSSRRRSAASASRFRASASSCPLGGFAQAAVVLRLVASRCCSGSWLADRNAASRAPSSSRWAAAHSRPRPGAHPRRGSPPSARARPPAHSWAASVSRRWVRRPARSASIHSRAAASPGSVPRGRPRRRRRPRPSPRS